ncbi:hypothetical protein [Tropicibacter sp. S64]|uniref:hypothetical protein n=1 Tax=Tropicibacter sp. S64 TaxID=3415122 RepID=UPI003C7DEA64
MSDSFTTRSFDVDTENNIVTITDTEIELTQGTLLPGYVHWIFAARIKLNGKVRLSGGVVNISAAEVSVGPQGAEVDVSGEDGKSFEPGTRAADGSGGGLRPVDGADGANGENGGDGGSGGVLNIWARTINGAERLKLVANGGKGGRGQDGGNGEHGAPPAARPDARSPKFVKTGQRRYPDGTGMVITVDDGYWDPAEDVIGKSGVGSLLKVTTDGKPGERGGDGGNAGLGGKGGNGGAAGAIQVRVLHAPEKNPVFSAAGGLKGGAGRHGTPGSGAAGGKGARLRYRSEIFWSNIGYSALDDQNDKARWDIDWNGSVHFDNLNVSADYVVKDAKTGKKKLRLRRPDGAHGSNGRYAEFASPPEVSPGSDGAKGYASISEERGAPSLRIPPIAHAVLLDRAATLDLADGRADDAVSALKWLRFVTSSRDMDETVAQIRDDADHRIGIIERGEEAQPLRTSFSDMDAAHRYVSAALSSAVARETMRDAHRKAVRDAADRKLELNDAIEMAESYLKQLEGNPNTPGSIQFLESRERAFKSDIVSLDRRLVLLGGELDNMPALAAEEMEAKIREKTEASFWEVVQVVGMVAGIAVNLSSALGSVKKLAQTVEEAYSKRLGTDFSYERLWSRSAHNIVNDLMAIATNSEFQKNFAEAFGDVKKTTGKLAKDALEFYGKYQAYLKLRDKNTAIDAGIDKIDLQARILVFETAKLEIQLQGNKLRHDLADVIDELSTAREWQYVFNDYFDTVNARFDILANLSDLQANLRELRFQHSLTERNILSAKRQLELVTAETDGLPKGSGSLSVETDAALELNRCVDLVREILRAYRIWTLETLPFTLPQRLTGATLLNAYTARIEPPILENLARKSAPANDKSRGISFDMTRFAADPEVLRRNFYIEDQGVWQFDLTVTIDPESDYWFERLLDVRVFLNGATTDAGSHFLCFVRHRGVSDYLDRNRNIVIGYKVPRAIEVEYVADGDGHKPAHNGIAQSFGGQDWVRQIHYSRYTTWEVQVQPDYKPHRDAMTYNSGLDLSGLKSIDFEFDSWRENYRTMKK